MKIGHDRGPVRSARSVAQIAEEGDDSGSQLEGTSWLWALSYDAARGDLSAGLNTIL